MDIVGMLGGYDSLMYSLVSVGCVVIGGLLLAATPFVLPIPVFGAGLLYGYIGHVAAETAMRLEAGSGWEVGVIEVVPVGFLVIEILVLWRMVDYSIVRYKKRYQSVNIPKDAVNETNSDSLGIQ